MVRHIASVIAAPNVDTVTLTEMGPLTRAAEFEVDAYNAFDALQAILLSFKTSLLSLSLRAINIPHFGRQDDILEPLPRLENLTVSLVERGWDDGDRLYEFLSDEFCPNLRCLTIMDCPCLSYDNSGHVDMFIEERFNMGNPIQRLAIRYCGDLGSGQAGLLERLRQRVTEFEYVA